MFSTFYTLLAQNDAIMQHNNYEEARVMTVSLDTKNKVDIPSSANALGIFGGITIVGGIIAGFVALNVDPIITLIIWVSCTISGTLLSGMGKIIELLATIANKDYILSEERTENITPKTEIPNKRIVASADSNSLSGFSILNGIIYTQKVGDKYEGVSISIGGSVNTSEVIDGVLAVITLVDVFGEIIDSRKISFIDLNINGNVFLTEGVSLGLSEHDSQRIREARVKIINYSKNGKKVLSYS